MNCIYVIDPSEEPLRDLGLDRVVPGLGEPLFAASVRTTSMFFPSELFRFF